MAAPVIELFPGVDEHPFASMIVELIRTNLADHPKKLRDFTGMRGRVALIAEDVDTAVTLRFEAGKLKVHPGLYGIPDLVIRGSGEALLDLSRVPPHRQLPFLPDLRSDTARGLARALRDGRLRMYGLLPHLGLGLRLSRVLSIY